MDFNEDLLKELDDLMGVSSSKTPNDAQEAGESGMAEGGNSPVDVAESGQGEAGSSEAVEQTLAGDESAAGGAQELAQAAGPMASGATPEQVENAIRQFAEKWEDRTRGDVFMKLLLSPQEDDFSGLVQASDEAITAEFVDDVYRVLAAQQKVQGRTDLTFTELVSSVRPDHTFGMSGDANLPANELVVVTDIAGFRTAQGGSKKAVLRVLAAMQGSNDFGSENIKFVFEQLAHIVDDRYVLFVGSDRDLEFILDQNRKLRFTFGDHLVELKYAEAPEEMGDQEAFEAFKRDVTPELASQIDDKFAERFARYIFINKRDLPFQGAELGDFLAKRCNATGILDLPEGRSFKYARAKLDKLVGLESVKKTMEDIAKYAVVYERDRKLGLKPPEQRFHMVFSGPPGTGKTTVGNIIAELLYEAGVISRATCETVSASKLVVPAVGGTSQQTQKIIERSRGGVLFIDEAYSLLGADGDGSHGVDAINTLVESMEREDDLVVVLGGYRDEINELIRSNPGLKSRISFTLDFEPYTKQQLLQIFSDYIASSRLTVEPEALEQVGELIDFFINNRDFGNARFIRQVFHRAYSNRAARITEGLGGDDISLVKASDIPSVSEMHNYERPDNERPASEKLADLVGVESVKEKVEDFKAMVAYRARARRAGLKMPVQTMHMVFSGNPGTGKTTVARIIADVLFECGVTPTPRFQEVSAQALIGEYVGHTGEKTRATLENSIGGVLFIDEAYSLLYNNDFGQDAIAEIVKFMEDYREQMVIILAGYSAEMRQLLDANPGMSSRIGYHFEFEDYEAEELYEIFSRKAQALGYSISEGAEAAARDVFRYFHSVENIGNGRFVDKMLNEVVGLHAKNVGDDDDISVLQKEDVPSNKDVCKIVSLPVHEPTTNDEAGIRRVAVHEMGHAVCGLDLMGNTGMKLVTIEAEATGALGYVQYEKDAFPSLPTRSDMMHHIAMCMGGMAAEKLCLGDYSAGNSSDLKQATSLAAGYVASYGMSDAGYISYPVPRQKDGSVTVEELSDEVRASMKTVLDEAYELALSTLTQRSAAHAKLVEKLISANTISGEEMVALWKEASQG